MQQKHSTFIRPGIDGWFERPLGAAIVDTENAAAERLLERVFGFVVVSIGSWWPVDSLLGACQIRRCLQLDEAGGDIISPLDNLALASDSVDAVLLPHTLEFVASPQRLLREVERILVGEGHVLIVGFNPWSAWTARRWIRRRHFPEQGRPLAAGRLTDWLELLGFEILATQSLFRRPPVDHAATLQRTSSLETLRWLPLPGNVYAILARKHVYTMTPIRPARNQRRWLAPGMASPAARMVSKH